MSGALSRVPFPQTVYDTQGNEVQGYLSPDGQWAPMPPPVQPIWDPANPVGTQALPTQYPPGDSLTAQAPGTFQPTRPWGPFQVSQQTYDAAHSAAGTALGFAGTFGGPMARTANLEKLRLAQDMAATDLHTARDIFDQTGWFQGVDGNWRFEISDKGADLMPQQPNPPRYSGLEDYITHPELFAAYPELGQGSMLVRGGLPPGASAGFRAPQSMNEVPTYYVGDQTQLPHILHEMQHGVQYAEGWAPGGSPQALINDPKIQPLIADEMQRISDRFMQSEGQPLDWSSSLGQSAYNHLLHRVYQRVSGEVEARQTEYRAGMTDAQRQAQAPWVYDTPWSEQIIRPPYRRY